MSYQHKFFDDDESEWTLMSAEVDKALRLICNVMEGMPLLPDDKQWLFTELPRKIHNTYLAHDRSELEHGCRMALSALNEKYEGSVLDAVQQMLIDHLKRALVELVPPIIVGAFTKFIASKVAAPMPDIHLNDMLGAQSMIQPRKESLWVKTEMETSLLQQGVFGWAAGLVKS